MASLIYTIIRTLSIFTTKTVWVYPSKNNYNGECLLDNLYLNFILDLRNKGFEIGLHNVGSGEFEREEIIKGLDLFNEKLGFYPKLHINHSNNKDNIYWGYERFQFVLKVLLKLFYGDARKFYGSDINSQFFWGDLCKKYIKYIRNYTFNDINTLKADCFMPYIDKEKKMYSNYWFSSSDGHTVREFNDLLNKKNVDRLEAEGGACIVYTHFAAGFINQMGEIDKGFLNKMEYLASKNGWFVPASTLLDFILKNKSNDYVTKNYLYKLDLKWCLNRIFKKIKYSR